MTDILLWKIVLKIVDFHVDNNVFWNTQNAPDCAILIQNFRGSMSPNPLPPSTNLNQHHYRANYAPGM